jgi:hypothetical protein
MSFGILKARNRWMLKGVQFADVATYSDHFVAGCILRNMCLAHEQGLTRGELAGLPLRGDYDDEFGGLMMDAASERRAQRAAAIAAFYQEELQRLQQQNLAQPGRRRSDHHEDADDAINIPEDAEDTMDLTVEYCGQWGSNRLPQQMDAYFLK